MSKSTAYFVLVMLVCWTAVIAAADYFVLGTTVRQYLSGSFAQTRCEIVKSEVTTHEGSLHSGLTVEYAYAVNGKDYRGWRYRYDDAYSSIAGADVAQHIRKWTEHTAYYDPKNPANSVLATGVDGGDLMLILFAVPVNAVMVLLWSWGGAWLRESWRVPAAGGVRIRRRDGKIRVRLGGLSAPAAGVAAMGGAAFVATFPVVALIGLSPSMEAMEWIWMAVIAVAAAAFCWTTVRNASGKYDMLIDEQSQAITLPQTARRRQPVTFSRGEMAGVCLQRRVSRLSSGSFYSFLPALERREAGAGIKREAVAPCGWTEEKGRAFSEWLAGQLGVEFAGVVEEEARSVG
jgi:hypothetical protein